MRWLCYGSVPLQVDLSCHGVNGVAWKFFGQVVGLLVWKHRTRFRVDERRDLLRFLVGEASRIQVRHRVSDNPRERVDARGARTVVPRIGPPQRSGLLVADRDALAVCTVTVRAALEKNRFALLCIELADRNELL